MDIVGALKSSAGHLLVIIDYRSRYPEAIPLLATKSPVIADEDTKLIHFMEFPMKS